MKHIGYSVREGMSSVFLLGGREAAAAARAVVRIVVGHRRVVFPGRGVCVVVRGLEIGNEWAIFKTFYFA